MLPELKPKLNRIIRIWKEGTWNDGEWKSSTTSVLKGIHIGNRPETTCEYLQEAYD